MDVEVGYVGVVVVMLVFGVVGWGLVVVEW